MTHAPCGSRAEHLLSFRKVAREIDERPSLLLVQLPEPQGELGCLRVSLPLVSGLMLPVLSKFAGRYPEIELDLDFSDRLVDVIDEGFDAVVRTGELSELAIAEQAIGFQSLPVCRLIRLLRSAWHTDVSGRPCAA
ncbi:LysR substrate-binding domain-containing protein [Variovorax boronicumulans]|uniref:LysR substrate-binding domain-containing protein n=1 Tax=Variovorax boronicumulans TaxID=436515 RepID=UPI00209C561B|nr:LysR substrate-binding domain-containing protein [Variovorax boronicumulans]